MKKFVMNFFEYSYTTNRTAVDGMVRINVGFKPLYRASGPSFFTIVLPTESILSVRLFT